jgi:5-deoxy-glucuronate isomerase
LSAAKGEVAICTARATEVFPVVHTPAQDVQVEVRGSGFASRQVTNIATPDSFKGAHKINICEVITPGGNVSSWPPHRHDGIEGCATNNEEIYYFRIGKMTPCTETQKA